MINLTISHLPLYQTRKNSTKWHTCKHTLPDGAIVKSWINKNYSNAITATILLLLQINTNYRVHGYKKESHHLYSHYIYALGEMSSYKFKQVWATINCARTTCKPPEQWELWCLESQIETTRHPFPPSQIISLHQTHRYWYCCPLRPPPPPHLTWVPFKEKTAVSLK